MSELPEMRQQILDNFYFHALLESDPYIIIAKNSAGGYQAYVMDKSENQVDSLTGEVAATAEEALRKLFDKSCERVQKALDDLGIESGSASDVSA
ncbi:hypothetical protein KCU81_g6028, partial [Aureobasidium melanogenum]|uniref:Uncharacterized protein n=1 Tax=Aureobasidium melanogenum (strain CBS 110374) TaxID=1043003 RepID=A0A074VZT6_AURM1